MINILLTIFIALSLSSCSSSNNDEIIKKQYILFEHGFISDSRKWNTYVKALPLCEDDESSDGVCYEVIRTDVPPLGSIEKRATTLAKYIHDNYSLVEDDSIIAVGHSMGGLDLRYIISKAHYREDDDKYFYEVAKKISKIYTIATPHKGNIFAGDTILKYFNLDFLPDNITLADAIRDMGIEEMKEFNKMYPYSTFSIDGREIPLYALRFRYSEQASSDLVVSLRSQSFNGAKHIKTPILGLHTNVDRFDAVAELYNIDILDGILKSNNDDFFNYAPEGTIPYQIFDIVFYDGYDCAEAEKGVFSTQNIPINEECSELHVGLNFEGKCAQNQIKSMQIFSTVDNNITVEVYSNIDADIKNSWAKISIGEVQLDEPFCINSFENNKSQNNITQEYFEGDDINNSALDGEVSYIKIYTASDKK